MRSKSRSLSCGCIPAAIIAIAALTLAPRAFAQRDLRDIPPPDPEQERQALQLGGGLEINLYAADPLLAKPIQMNFDARGRLWIATSETYPHIVPGQAANDKIIVLEDADRDGRADKTHVFADGLLIPTGIEPGDGGAYVANSTELIHFKDLDGDLKADEKKTLLSGFGTEDTHHLLHTLRWGPDGRLYMNQSIYIHSHIETPYGVRRLNGGGIWQYDPQTHRLEIFARGWVNAWGHAFDKWGNSFVTDGAGGEGINYAFPGAVYPTAPGAPRVLHGMNPGSPKYCGLEIISGRHWPDDWQGDLITCDFRAHRIVRFTLSEQGSGYTARQLPDLVKTQHVAFRPIDVKLGPDGALYIADWYNPIIQHGEVDFRDPRRDHTHGRIWRVTVKGRDSAPWPALAGAKPQALIDALQSEEPYIRHHAKRQFVEREPEFDRQEVSYVALRFSKPRNDFLLDYVEMMWLNHARKPYGVLVEKNLAADDPHVRAAAIRLSPALLTTNAPIHQEVAANAAHTNPQVRLAAICALNNSPLADAVGSALIALDQPLDENLDFALWQLCRERRKAWLPEVVAGKSPLYERPAHLEFALRAIDEPLIVPPLLKLLHDGKLPAERREGVLELIARLGEPKELAMIYDLIVNQAKDKPEMQLPLLKALYRAATERKVRPVVDVKLLVAGPLQSPDEQVSATSARLLGAWKDETARQALTQLAQSATEPTERTYAALAALADLGGPHSREVLDTIAQRLDHIRMKQAAVIGLTRFDLEAAARGVHKLMSGTSPEEYDVAAVIEAFTSRPEAAKKLREVLPLCPLPPDAAKLAVRTVLTSAKPDLELVAALRKAGGIEGTGLKLSPEQTAALVSEIKERGNPQRGEAIYLRKDLGCTKCHAIGGAGGKVGPDLVSIGASAQVDYLVDSIVVPNKAVKEGFHTVIAELDDGRVLNGVKVRQTDKDLILRDAEDREVTVPLKSIESQAPGLSLMPAGLADNLTRDELIDLVRFLSELGKAGGPYQLSQAKLVRRWETVAPTKESYEVVRRAGIGAATGDDSRLQWQPQYSRVDGTLPIETLPAFAAVQNQFMSVPPYTVVRFQFDVAATGEVEFAFDDVVGLQASLDGKPLDLKRRTRFAATSGRHTLALIVDRKTRTAPLRCELVDMPGSSAAATLVLGK